MGYTPDSERHPAAVPVTRDKTALAADLRARADVWEGCARLYAFAALDDTTGNDARLARGLRDIATMLRNNSDACIATDYETEADERYDFTVTHEANRLWALGTSVNDSELFPDEPDDPQPVLTPTDNGGEWTAPATVHASRSLVGPDVAVVSGALGTVGEGKVMRELFPWPVMVNDQLRAVGFDGAVVRHNGETWATARTMADQRILEELGWTVRQHRPGDPHRLPAEPTEYRYSPPHPCAGAPGTPEQGHGEAEPARRATGAVAAAESVSRLQCGCRYGCTDGQPWASCRECSGTGWVK